MAIFTFSVESMIRGYHEHIHIWESPSPTDNVLPTGDWESHDTHVVAVKENVAGTMESRQQFVTFRGSYLQYFQYLLDMEVLLIVLSMARVVILQIYHKVDLKYPVS